MPHSPQELASHVSAEFKGHYERLVQITDVFCDDHLNDEYKHLCRKMAAAMCQAGSPVVRGKAEGWAAGIVYALGRVNFLTDPSQTPHMTAIQIARGLNVSKATMTNKAKVIREELDLFSFHPDWSLPSRMDDNPLAWMLQVNGFLMDIRDAPREAQVVAYENGLIPYIPVDRDAEE